MSEQNKPSKEDVKKGVDGGTQTTNAPKPSDHAPKPEPGSGTAPKEDK